MTNGELLEHVKSMMDALIDSEYRVSVENGLDLDRDDFEMEFLAATLYLAGADNNISAIEVDLVNYVFDQNLSPQTMGPLIKTLSESYNALIVDLELPGWKICKRIDAVKGDSEATDAYISTMGALMILFGGVDGNLDANEEKFINDYVNRLERDR